MKSSTLLVVGGVLALMLSGCGRSDTEGKATPGGKIEASKPKPLSESAMQIIESLKREREHFTKYLGLSFRPDPSGQGGNCKIEIPITLDNAVSHNAHAGTRIYLLMPRGEKAMILVPHGSKRGGTVRIKSKSSDKILELSENVPFQSLGRQMPFAQEGTPTYGLLLDLLQTSSEIEVDSGAIAFTYQLHGLADAYSALQHLCRPNT